MIIRIIFCLLCLLFSISTFSCEQLKYSPEWYSGKLIRVKATIEPENLNCGSSVTASIRKKIKESGFPSDEGGHVIAKALGGLGSVASNVVPMSRKANNGKYKSAERKVIDCLKRKGGYAKLDVKIKYNDRKHPFRPTSFMYKAVLEKCSNVSITIEND